MSTNAAKKSRLDYLLLFIVFLSLLSFVRLLLLHDVNEDDNCWLMSIYTSSNVREFLDMGFTQMRREPMGVFLYYFYRLHKTCDYAFWIWQSVNIAIQVITATFIYFFSKNLFKNTPLAFLIVICFVICPIDSTTPVFTNLTYRLGLMLAVISLFLTHRAVRAETVNWVSFLFAMLCSGFAQYVLVEGVIALEPARLLVIGYVVFQKKDTRRVLFGRAILLWLPFCVLCVPLVIYKLTVKPLGLYDGCYSTSPLFLLDISNYLKVVRHFLFYWVYLIEQIEHVTLWSFGLGFFSLAISYFVWKRVADTIGADAESLDAFSWKGLIEKGKRSASSMKFEWILAIVLFIAPVLFYMLVGRVPANGPNSRHALVPKLGYAFISGVIVYSLFRISRGQRLRRRLLLIMVFFSASGVFLNNLNLDIYFAGWERQQKFWKAFTERFPSVPDDAIFITEVEYDETTADLDTSYDFEFVLNMLYARSTNPSEFRSYKVINVDEWRSYKQNKGPFSRITAWGSEIMDPADITVVRYINDELFVNKEIIGQDPDESYTALLDKDFPELPVRGRYPLRAKLKWSLRYD